MAPRIHEKCNIKKLLQVTISVVVANQPSYLCDIVDIDEKRSAHAHDMTQIEGGHIDDRVGAVPGPRNFFPINAPGMGRFKLFDLVGYS